MADPVSPNTRPRGLAVYLLPNLLTTAALFAGFYAILTAIRGNFSDASIAIFVAMVLDGLDGRVARLTQTQSAFGAEYDNLSDMVAFGLAPSLVMFLWALSDLGRVGWFAAFVYAATTALRLARFNVQIGVTDKRYFQGLPSPSAAAILAGAVWLGTHYNLIGQDLAWPAGVLTVSVGLLMVSNFRYFSFKDMAWHDRVPFLTAVAIMVGFAVTFLYPALVLFSLFLMYAVSGPVITWNQRRRKRERRPSPSRLPLPPDLNR
ncbi:CDP-diacylglycerol---serine O-phosphatidyltransferase [Gammaproteobacteria bacterium]